jgi:uncharacterized protein YcfJ
MKPLILCIALLGIAFTPTAAEAKGCIKGAIVGGVAGHLAGHGKVGAVAECIIGRHEANEQNAPRTDQKVRFSRQPHLGRNHALRRAGLGIAVGELRQ